MQRLTSFKGFFAGNKQHADLHCERVYLVSTVARTANCEASLSQRFPPDRRNGTKAQAKARSFRHRDHPAMHFERRMGVLYRCPDQTLAASTGQDGNMGIHKPHGDNGHRHGHRDCRELHDTEVRIFPFARRGLPCTCLPFVTHSCFTRAANHALRQHIGARGSISLADLSMGVAVASASFRFKRKRRYIGPTLGTLIIAIVFGLVNSAYVFMFEAPVQSC